MIKATIKMNVVEYSVDEQTWKQMVQELQKKGLGLKKTPQTIVVKVEQFEAVGCGYLESVEEGEPHELFIGRNK